MDPNNRQLNRQSGNPFSDQSQPDQSLSRTASLQDTHRQVLQQQDAAANVIRSRIDTLFTNTPTVVPTQQPQPQVEQQPTIQPAQAALVQAVPQESAQPEQQNLSQTTLQHSLETENPYYRTHEQHPLPQAEQWKAYHTAWQQYYQKYYEQYYTHETENHKKKLTNELQQQQMVQSEQPHVIAEEPVSQDEALTELRAKLLGKVQASAKKVRKSRHFIPIVAALSVVLLFVFIQYNRVFIANVQAYVAPGNLDPQNIVIDPTADVTVSSDPRLIIPKINVDVPVIYDVGTDNTSQMAAMEKGVAHFPIPGANSHPGEVGNTVIAGHSSNDLFDPGAYKFIFAQLEKLQVGDTIYANYNSKRYTYVITKTETVKPNEVNKLIYPTDKPVMTLITCTPLGTALNRLLVTAEQVSPDPAEASAAPAPSSSGESAAIPGNSSTLLERLFGN